MPGDIFAMATTFSTVVRDGPWMCSAEMHASISRMRWRPRAALARGLRGIASRGMACADAALGPAGRAAGAGDPNRTVPAPFAVFMTRVGP